MDFILLTSYNKSTPFSLFQQHSLLHNSIDNLFHLFKYLGKFKFSNHNQIISKFNTLNSLTSKSFQDLLTNNKKNYIYTSFYQKQLKGSFSSFLIKGYGKRAKKSKSLFLFRIGLREKSGSLPKRIIPSALLIKSKKKKTFFKCFTINKLIQKAFFQNVIHLQGSSRKLPAFSYKDIGIRLYGKKAKKKVRRV